MNKTVYYTEPQVELIGYYGGDLTHAASGWTSTLRDLTPDKLERMPKFLKMLMLKGHHTPFEKSALHFLVTVDQATHIHLLKHRISSVNGESARYKELNEDRILIPQGLPQGFQKGIAQLAEHSFENYHFMLKECKEQGISRKRAKEACRYVLPYNSMIQLDVMYNFSSFMNLQWLRNSKHAQVEVRILAQKMYELVQQIEGNPFQYTLEAFELYKTLKEKMELEAEAMLNAL